MKIIPLARWLVTLLCLGALVANAAPPQRWTMVELGDLAGGIGSSTALAINNRGDITGYATAAVPGGGHQIHAFVWQNGTMLDLGTPPGAFMSDAIDINDRGAVLGGDGRGGSYLWQDGVWERIVAPGIVDQVNKFGDLAGVQNVGGGRSHAYLYRDGVVFDVGTLGGTSSVPSGLNDRGAVVGSSWIAGNAALHAFYYRDGVIKDLGTLGGTFSDAYGVNNHGVVVGASLDANRDAFAFIHDGSTMRRLLPGLGPPQRASAINDRGAVVGDLGQNGSFLYDDDAVTILESIPEVRAGGWLRLIPTAINDRGWITGWGIKAGFRTGGFVLIPR